MSHGYISTIYPLNRKSKNWRTFVICFTFTFTFSNDGLQFLLFFYFSIYFFYFSFYFSKFRKKIRSTNFFNALQWCTWAIIGITAPKSSKFKKNAFFVIKNFPKKWKIAVFHLGRCCVYFVYPEPDKMDIFDVFFLGCSVLHLRNAFSGTNHQFYTLETRFL